MRRGLVPSHPDSLCSPLFNRRPAPNKDAMPYILMFGALMLFTLLVSCLAVI